MKLGQNALILIKAITQTRGLFSQNIFANRTIFQGKRSSHKCLLSSNQLIDVGLQLTINLGNGREKNHGLFSQFESSFLMKTPGITIFLASPQWDGG